MNLQQLIAEVISPESGANAKPAPAKAFRPIRPFRPFPRLTWETHSLPRSPP